MKAGHQPCFPGPVTYWEQGQLLQLAQCRDMLGLSACLPIRVEPEVSLWADEQACMWAAGSTPLPWAGSSIKLTAIATGG